MKVTNVITRDIWSNGDVTVTKLQHYRWAEVSDQDPNDVLEFGNCVDEDYFSDDAELIAEITDSDDF